MNFQLEPQLLFGILVGAPLLLMLGMGVFAAVALYILDRQVMDAHAEGEEVSKPVPSINLEPATAAPSSTPVPSPLTQKVLAGGDIEETQSLGVPHTKLGVWAFLASEIMFFTALIGAYLAFRVGGQFTFVEMEIVREALNVPLAAANTFLLIVSSFTVVMALEAVQEDRMNRFVLFLLASLALGSTFIAIQGIEWTELLHHGITPTETMFGTVFFVLTGFHGLHVIIGLFWLTFALLKAFRGDFTQEQNMGIEMFGLYWHFVDIVWIVLFTLIYLIQ